jgi:hypothetical protein
MTHTARFATRTTAFGQGLHPDGLRALDSDHPRSEEPRLATAGHRRPGATTDPIHLGP